MKRVVAMALAAPVVAVVVYLAGCAYGGEDQPAAPEVVMDLIVTFAGPVDEAHYYFMAFNVDGDFGAAGPLPVAAGPNWGNGWGTGALSHYVEYHQGRYELFRAQLAPELIEAAGGIVGVEGTPDSAAAGIHAITIDALNLGAATIEGEGAIAAVTNNSFQAAGTLALQANAAGEVVAGSVSWTPAANGGRPLTAAEQAQIDALNAGGVALAADSLSALGLTLTLHAGPDRSGVQTITIAPTTADVTDRFTPEGPLSVAPTQSELPANNHAPLTGGPIPGMTIRTGDLVVGETARIRLLPDPVGRSLGVPYDSTLPQGGRTLRVTLDRAQLGPNVSQVSINFITTTELIFDPTVVNPDAHTYDGLGRWGNDYFTILTNQFQTIRNGDLLTAEEADDPTLEGPASPQARASVDIVDWSVTVRRLR
jgi:hypothetical protein